MSVRAGGEWRDHDGLGFLLDLALGEADDAIAGQVQARSCRRSRSKASGLSWKRVPSVRRQGVDSGQRKSTSRALAVRVDLRIAARAGTRRLHRSARAAAPRARSAGGAVGSPPTSVLSPQPRDAPFVQDRAQGRERPVRLDGRHRQPPRGRVTPQNGGALDGSSERTAGPARRRGRQSVRAGRCRELLRIG